MGWGGGGLSEGLNREMLGGVLGIKYLHVFNFASYINKISLS